MGYESKVIIVDRHEINDEVRNLHWVYGDEICRFDMSKMGYEEVEGKRFPEIFTHEIDFDIFMGNHEDDYRHDCYGEHCKWAEPKDVARWLKKSEVLKDYRRAKVLYGFLKMLEKHKEEWNQLCVVHYGY